MDQNEAAIRDTSMGCTVTNYYKISTDPIEYIQAVELQARIDSGVSIMTFLVMQQGQLLILQQTFHKTGTMQDAILLYLHSHVMWVIFIHLQDY